MLFIGIAILVIGHQLWLKARGWRFDTLSPYFMCDLMIFTLVGLGSLVVPLPHKDFIEELAFCLYIWSGLVTYYFGLHLRLRFPAFRLLRITFPLGWLRRHIGFSTLILAGGFAFVTLLTLLRRTQALGLSLREMLTISPLQRYAMATAAELGALPVVIIYLITVLLLMQLYQLLQRRRYIAALNVYTIINLSYLLVSATRIPIIMNLAIPIAYYHFAVRRINKLLLVGIIFGAPIALTVLHGFRGGYNLFAFRVSDVLINEAGVMQSFHRLWQECISGNLTLEYGLTYYYFFLTFVPRALWKEKPLTSFEARWTANLYGGLLQDNQIWVHTFTPWGEGLVQFGWLGSVINLFLYGLILNIAIRFFNRRLHACLVYFYYTILAATYIRISVQGLLFTTMLYITGVWLYERWLMPKTAR